MKGDSTSGGGLSVYPSSHFFEGPWLILMLQIAMIERTPSNLAVMHIIGIFLFCQAYHKSISRLILFVASSSEMQLQQCRNLHGGLCAQSPSISTKSIKRM